MSTSRRSFMGAAGLYAAALTQSAMSSAAGAAAASGATAPGATSRGFDGYLRVADGTELFVRDWGRGRPVVLTHAWPMSADCWDQQAVDLVDAGYRVISYDRRGFGGRTLIPGFVV